jgi:hypothetical protein
MATWGTWRSFVLAAALAGALTCAGCGEAIPTAPPSAKGPSARATSLARETAAALPSSSPTPSPTPSPTATRTARPSSTPGGDAGAPVAASPTGSRTATPGPASNAQPSTTPRIPPTATRRVTATPAPCLSAQERPELWGRIIFWSDRESIPGINVTGFYVMNADGSQPELLDERAKCAALLYSYYQKRLGVQSDGGFVLTVDRAAYGMDINMRDAGNNLVRRINAFYAMSYDPAWSPDGSRIAFVSEVDGNDEIYVIEPNSTRPLRLTANTWEWDKHPTWSPDGQQIAFWSNRVTARKQIWVMQEDGTDARNLSENTFNDWDPIWVR